MTENGKNKIALDIAMHGRRGYNGRKGRWEDEF